MGGRSGKYALALAAALAFATPAMGQVADPVPAADKLFASMTPDRPGAVVLITQGQKTLYARAFGAADLEQDVPIKLETKFHVASLSKQFTAFAVALLAHEGRLRLDEDVRTYLPELPDFGTRITVADLLHHTSGLRDQWDLFSLAGTDIQSLLTQQAILSLVRRQKALNFAPGTEYRYSNTGYSLAAEIVARVSGMPFRRFVQDRVFTPLGMTNSVIYDNAAEIVPGRAQSYSVARTGELELRRLNFSNYGATSMISTAEDLHKWSRELLDPAIFEPGLIRSLYQPATLTGGISSNYGLGLHKSIVRGREAIMHTGSDAGFRAVMASYPADKLNIIIISNGSAELMPLHEALLDIFAPGGTPRSPEIAPPPRQLAQLAGYYASGWGYGFELKVENGRLVRIFGGSSGPVTFRADGMLEFAAPNVRFRISKGADGRAAALEEQALAGPPVRYGRVERQPVPAADLKALAGDYRSEELDITYTLAVSGDRLTLSSLQSPEPKPLAAIRRDWFDMPFGRVTVVRGAGDRPTGIRVTTGRSRNVHFDRVD